MISTAFKVIKQWAQIKGLQLKVWQSSKKQQKNFIERLIKTVQKLKAFKYWSQASQAADVLQCDQTTWSGRRRRGRRWQKPARQGRRGRTAPS